MNARWLPVTRGTVIRVLLALFLMAGTGLASVAAAGLPPRTGGSGTLAGAPVGGVVQMDNACYVRLPDLPRALYGGFSGYNQDTGVLAYAGGAQVIPLKNVIVYHDLYAIRLDGTMTSWAPIPYAEGMGYSHDADTGCRDMASVQVAPDRWVSVGGRDGCNGGRQPLGGDIREIQIGNAATPAEVRWVPNTGVDLLALPTGLRQTAFILSRPFAVWDSVRQRIVFGQGSVWTERDALSRDDVYQATRVGSNWHVEQLWPTGQAPVRRYGSCAAYVRDKDSGVDGVIVLGGQQGGSTTTLVSYKEVWWLDFSKSPDGQWVDITKRFANMDELGYRREGACAYDADAKTFYSWMGRSDPALPDGASHSSGVWSVNLSTLADPAASLTWVRLAKDKADDPIGRRLIPSVFDAKNHRFFAVGGLTGLDEHTQVWAIYPGLTGDACANVDPYAPIASLPTPTPAGTPLPPLAPGECPFIAGRVPPQARTDALANPASVYGYGLLCRPELPPSPLNTVRDRLTLINPSRPYHPLYNTLAWSCTCP